MFDKLIEFRQLVDTLRESRREKSKKADEYRLILGQIEDLVDSMNDDEQEIANSEGWRGWPDLYDERLRSLIETIDPDNAACADQPPRQYSEVA